MRKVNRFQQWLKVGRIQTAMVTALALWVGYVTVADLTPTTFVALGVVGILLHTWGFVLNEVKDKEYDERYSDSSGHPLAGGDISTAHANAVAWVAGGIAVTFCTIIFNSLFGILLLLMSFAAGTFYNIYSKRHWWSNAYLSIWVLLLTLSGAAFAGSFSIFTWAIGGALAIQIFVQVIEGDMKDILGPEHTMAERMGVRCSSDNIMCYPSMFRKTINILKMIELGLVGYIVYANIDVTNRMDIAVLAILSIFACIFIATTTYYLTARMDRDKIKKRSSIHELASVMMLGISSYWLDYNSAIFIALAPVVWYVLVNKMLHSGAMNPDI